MEFHGILFLFFKDSGDIHFVASVQDWYSPYNWQDVTLPSSEIILHTDNVPCVHDTVIFPQVSKLNLVPILRYIIVTSPLKHMQNAWDFFHNLFKGQQIK